MFLVLRGLMLFVLLVWMPGAWLTTRWLKGSTLIERVGVGIGLGILFVGFLAFALAVSTFTADNIGYLALFAVPVDLLFLRELWLRARAEGWRAVLPRPSRREAAVLGLAAAIAAAYALRYHREFFSYSCLNRDTARLLGLTVGIFDWSLSIFEPSETLLANTILISPFPMLFGFLGFRLSLATYTGLIAILAYLLSVRLTSRHWVGILTMLFLVTTPAYLVNYIMDPNILTFFTTMLFVYLTLREDTSPAAIALAGSLMFGSQHLLLLCLAVPLLRPEPRRWRFITRYILWLIPFCSLWFAHHLLAFGNPFFTESYWECECHAHSFFGHEFMHHGLMNWPFTDHIVRTPYNPLPASLQMPMYHLSRMGRVAAAFVLAGAGALFILRRRAFVILAVFTVPPVLLLAIQANWMQVEKWGIPLLLYPIVVAAFAAGVDALARPELRRRFLALFVAGLAATYLFTGVVDGLSFPQDERFYDEFPELIRERSEYVDFERARLGDVSLWPDYRDVHAELSFRRSLVVPLWHDLLDPGFDREWTDREHGLSYMIDRLYGFGLHQQIPPARPGDTTQAFRSDGAASLLIEISLEAPLLGSEVLRVVDAAEGPVIDLTAGEIPAPIYNMIVPWAEHPQSLAVFGTGDGLPVINFFFRAKLMRDAYMVFDAFEIEDRSLAFDATPQRIPGDRLWFRVDPRKELIVVDNLCVEPSRIYSWRVRFEDGQPLFSPTFRWRHD